MKDRLMAIGGGIVAGTLLLLLSRTSPVLANLGIVGVAVAALRGCSAGMRLVRTRDVFEKRTLPYSNKPISIMLSRKP